MSRRLSGFGREFHRDALLEDVAGAAQDVADVQRRSLGHRPQAVGAGRACAEVRLQIGCGVACVDGDRERMGSLLTELNRVGAVRAGGTLLSVDSACSEVDDQISITRTSPCAA